MASVKLPVLASAAVAVFLGLGIGLAVEPPVPSPPPNVPLAAPLVVPPRGDPEVQLIPPPGARDTEPPSNANPSRSANFIVHAPTPTMARAIAAEAEHQRAGLAKQWLGKELPPAEKPHVIRFTSRQGAAGGATTFTFAAKDAKPGVRDSTTELHGEFLDVLTNHLPHETMHVVLATHFGRPLPRWADEGIAVAAEGAASQYDHEVRCRELLNAGRCIRLRVLLRMNEYPRDMIVMYTQGNGVVRFLLTQPVSVDPPVLGDVPYLGRLFKNVANPHQQLVLFLHMGMDGNTAESWDKAAKSVYGFESVDAMEEAWLKSLKTPPVRPKAGTPETPKPKTETPTLIPPPSILPPVLPRGERP